MSAHLGLAATAFVDGELEHERRDEVLAHLTHCTACRAEVELLRQVKAALRTAAPAVPSDLAARLLASMAPPVPVDPAPAAARSAHRPRRSAMHPRLHPRLRRTAVGASLVALGLGGALSLAGPPPRGPMAPVDPTSAGFVLDHGATSNEVPFTELDVVSVSSSRTSP